MVLVATGSSNASQDTDMGVLWLPGGAGRAVRASKGRGGLRLVQNHFGFLKTSADACLTLCTAGETLRRKRCTSVARDQSERPWSLLL